VANGTFTVQGLQTGLPNQGQNRLGPFTFSFTATEWDTVVGLSSGSNTVTVPPGAGGVWVIPPSGGTVTLQLGSLGYINPRTPTYWCFDTITPNVPATFTITAGGSVSVGIRFT
jgi:hypothetical protein